MTAPPQLPRQERRQRVRALAEVGLSARSIARELGVDRATVGRDLACLGLLAVPTRSTTPGRCRPAATGLSTTLCGHTWTTCTCAAVQHLHHQAAPGGRTARGVPRPLPADRDPHGSAALGQSAAAHHAAEPVHRDLQRPYLLRLVPGVRAPEQRPARRLPRPKLPRMLPRPMSERDLKRAIGNADGRVRVWLVLAGYAGLRCIEIAALYRHDILDGGGPARAHRSWKGQQRLCGAYVPAGHRRAARVRHAPARAAVPPRRRTPRTHRCTPRLRHSEQALCRAGHRRTGAHFAPPLWHRDVPCLAGHPRRAGTPRARLAVDYRRRPSIPLTDTTSA